MLTVIKIAISPTTLKTLDNTQHLTAAITHFESLTLKSYYNKRHTYKLTTISSQDLSSTAACECHSLCTIITPAVKSQTHCQEVNQGLMAAKGQSSR